NLSQQRPALQPLHTFLSRASVKLLKTPVASPLGPATHCRCRCLPFSEKRRWGAGTRQEDQEDEGHATGCPACTCSH
ncbi:unnamed protein product, partial [Closterium sp. Naga37s-1]